jgi:hypothetical protein
MKPAPVRRHTLSLTLLSAALALAAIPGRSGQPEDELWNQKHKGGNKHEEPARQEPARQEAPRQEEQPKASPRKEEEMLKPTAPSGGHQGSAVHANPTGPTTSPAFIKPTGPQPTGPQPAGPQPTGPLPTGPRPAGPRPGTAVRGNVVIPNPNASQPNPSGQAGIPHLAPREPLKPLPRPGVEVIRPKQGGEIYRGAGGAVREVRTPNGAVVHYAPDGQRHVELARPDGRVFFTSANGRGGYVQRPFELHGQPFVQRTYVQRGVAYTRVYRPWVYGGVTFNVYQPVHFYRPAFYAWTWHPWPRPVYYRWGWAAQPWYGYYGRCWAPYPYYPSPVFWLTDFVVSVTFEDAYQARLDSELAPPPDNPAVVSMTPDVKQAIADEVQRQLQEERDQQQAAAQGYAPPADQAPPLFSNSGSRVFLADHSVLAYAGARECFLSEGDVLQLNGPPAPNASYADVVVLYSRSPSCPRGSVVAVSLTDLQEMQNQMRATVDQGLGQLQNQQGQEGLPALPQANLGSTAAPYAAGVQADPSAAAELSQAALEADTEAQATLGQAPPAPAPAPTAGGTIALGMNPEQVHAILGSPRRSAMAGSRTIEVYQDFKVTYTDGVVTDIQ